MQYLLDTNICIYLIKKKPPKVSSWTILITHSVGRASCPFGRVRTPTPPFILFIYLLAQFQALALSDIGISSITVAELEYGVCKSQQQEKNRNALMQFLIPLEIVEFDQMAATVYGSIRSELEHRGLVIGVQWIC
jgi:tRNA(fMet)-specific endonuclease VapC